MTLIPTFDNGVVQLYQGDARQVLRELSAESVHSVVTSPPYWGLRDYGLEPLVWGGDEGHEHEWGSPNGSTRHDKTWASSSPIGNRPPETIASVDQGANCYCGAWRGSLGLEPTIDLYVQHIVEIFREVRRVLRKDGTLWLNMGDSYTASAKGNLNGQDKSGLTSTRTQEHAPVGISKLSSLKPKDLCMMPARVALALQSDGWWLRSDIVWSKPNPMPESVTDRPTRAHEYVFLLTKSERYYYDAEAIKEEVSGNTHSRGPNHHEMPKQSEPGSGIRYNSSFEAATWGPVSSRNKRSVWEIATEPMGTEQCERDGLIYDATQYRKLPRLDAPYCDLTTHEEGIHTYVICRGGAHWDWSSHFACFPEALVEPCVLAGTSERGVCPECDAPWERVVERRHEAHPNRWSKSANAPGDYSMETGEYAEKGSSAGLGVSTVSETTGWRPTCDCGHEDTVPGMVLDPFAGSGTVAYVAQRLGRRAIGIDLSAEYLALAEKRMRGQTLPMAL